MVENHNRGIFGEWLVGQALGVIGDDEVRQEWDAVDLHFDGLAIEVKTSGFFRATTAIAWRSNL